MIYELKMQLTHIHYNLRKHFFSSRIIAVWNNLPNDVFSVHSTNIFKNYLVVLRLMCEILDRELLC
jgi:hypothetical protein